MHPPKFDEKVEKLKQAYPYLYEFGLTYAFDWEDEDVFGTLTYMADNAENNSSMMDLAQMEAELGNILNAQEDDLTIDVVFLLLYRGKQSIEYSKEFLTKLKESVDYYMSKAKLSGKELVKPYWVENAS